MALRARKLLLVFGAVVAFGLSNASRADALLMAAIDVNGVQACATDNNVFCGFGTQITDLDPAVGVMSFGNVPVVIGGLAITGSSQQQIITATQNILNTSSTQLENVSGGVLNVNLAIGATDYLPQVFQAFVSGSSTWENAVGSSITMQWFNDPNNAQGGETSTDTPGVMLDSFTDAITLIADSTAYSNGPIAINDPNNFSMTLFTNLTMTAGAKAVNRGQTLIKPYQVVPEPATTALFGLGLATVFLRRRLRGR
jgi:hypothetical protein